MKMWLRVTASAVLMIALAAFAAGCCATPPKIATFENVVVKYETRPTGGDQPVVWGPEPVRKVVITSDQILVFEQNRVQAVPILKLKTLEWTRADGAK